MKIFPAEEIGFCNYLLRPLNQLTMTTDFELWNKKDYSGGHDTYTGNQGQSGINNTNSLKTFDSTWVIIFSENDYDQNLTGDYALLGPNTYWDHLKDQPRGSNGDDNWENNLNSFILYKEKPTWWNGGTRPTYDQLFLQANHNALFTKGTNYQGSNGVFTAPSSQVVLLDVNYTSSGAKMDDEYDPGNISSISTGDNAWLLVFSGSSCVGDFYKIDPITAIPDLGTIDRCDMNGDKQGDWANDISSFLLYSSEPIFWGTDYPGPYLDNQSLSDACPNGSISGSQVEYSIVNNTFKISEPTILQSATQSLPSYHGAIETDDLPEDGWTSFYFELEHHNAAGKNDDAHFYLIFDNSSNIIAIQHFYWEPSDGAFSIDETTIATVDLDLELIGIDNTPETGGISDAAATVLSAVFDFVSGAFNHIANAIFDNNDDGGRFYFLPVICHSINRVTTTIFNNYGVNPYSTDNDPRANLMLNLDCSDYKMALQQSDMNYDSIADWSVYPNAVGSAPNNEVMEQVYRGCNYRTWYLESSLTQSLGMLVSCKIDYEPESGNEDHVILMAGFTMPIEGSTEPILAFAQAMIAFTDDSDENIVSALYSSGDIVGQLYDDLQEQLSSLTFDSDNAGRAYMADITKANLNAIVACTTTQTIS